MVCEAKELLLVRMRGLEPPRCHHHRLLRPARLPVPPHPRETNGHYANASKECQEALRTSVEVAAQPVFILPELLSFAMAEPQLGERLAHIRTQIEAATLKMRTFAP